MLYNTAMLLTAESAKLAENILWFCSRSQRSLRLFFMER